MQRCKDQQMEKDIIPEVMLCNGQWTACSAEMYVTRCCMHVVIIYQIYILYITHYVLCKAGLYLEVINVDGGVQAASEAPIQSFQCRKDFMQDA